MSTVRTLLNFYKWDSTRLIREYFETGPELFFAQIPMNNPFIEQAVQDADCDSDECRICCTEFSSVWNFVFDFAFIFTLFLYTQDFYGLGCGHAFCNPCWNQYLTVKIVDDGLHEVKCPETNCDALIDDENIRELVMDTDVIVKYNRAITNSYVLVSIRYISIFPYLRYS